MFYALPVEPNEKRVFVFLGVATLVLILLAFVLFQHAD